MIFAHSNSYRHHQNVMMAENPNSASIRRMLIIELFQMFYYAFSGVPTCGEQCRPIHTGLLARWWHAPRPPDRSALRSGCAAFRPLFWLRIIRDDVLLYGVGKSSVSILLRVDFFEFCMKDVVGDSNPLRYSNNILLRVFHLSLVEQYKL